MPISLRKKGRISFKSNIITAIGRSITSTSVSKIQRESEKTIVGFGNFHVDDCN